MTKRICIIEDEKDIVRLLSYNLEKEGYEIFMHGSGDGSVDFIQAHQPDLVLLDLMIPGIDGFEVCKRLKSNTETASIPIIMITAKTENVNVVTGLELGAEDYITKPFSVEIMIARVRAVLRRGETNPDEDQSVLRFQALEIYPERYEVFVDSELVDLNHSEFKLLLCLATKPGRVFSRTQLLDQIQGGSEFVTKRLIDVLLVSIRKKLGNAASYIQTVRGVGYKFKEEK